jgi:hypothetical protein
MAVTMATLIGASGRAYIPLPIGGNLGFPQSFPVLFAGSTYRFRLYVNAPASRLNNKTTVFDLPSPDAFLVVQVEAELPDAARQPIFLRKVVPGLEYEVKNLALMFAQQRVAVGNLNGQGEFGTVIIGGIAPRWA